MSGIVPFVLKLVQSYAHISTLPGLGMTKLFILLLHVEHLSMARAMHCSADNTVNLRILHTCQSHNYQAARNRAILFDRSHCDDDHTCFELFIVDANPFFSINMTPCTSNTL